MGMHQKNREMFRGPRPKALGDSATYFLDACAASVESSI